VRVNHGMSAGFDDPNLISCEGLVPVLALVERARLHDLVDEHVRVPGSVGTAFGELETGLRGGPPWCSAPSPST
jgi:hypothetical protein